MAVLLAFAGILDAFDVTVRWNELLQRISGFGAGTACPTCAGGGAAFYDNDAMHIYSLSEPARTDLLDLLFDTTKGIGLSNFRMGESWMLEDPDGTWHWARGSGEQQEIWVAKEAQKRNPNIKFWSAPWTPPLWMKTVQTMGGGSLQTQYYQRYADYKSRLIRDMRDKEGINLVASSVQNEPHFNPNYGGCYYSGANLRDFVKNNLGPTFVRDGVAAKIMIAETNWNQPAWVDVSMADSIARDYVGIAGFHTYETDVLPYPKAAQYGKEVWMTEASGAPWGGIGDLTMTQAMPYVQQLHKCMSVARTNAWVYYEFAGGGNPPVRLNGGSYLVAKLLYCLGNYSKFVKLGWRMIGATNYAPDSLFVGTTAYRDSTSGKFAIIATNWDKIGPHDISFTLQGFRTAKVTPWLTDDNAHSISQQADIPVTGGLFTATLPALSITTFTGAAVPIAASDAEIDAFVASKSWTAPGSPVTLAWATKNASSASINNGVGAVAASGTAVVSPSSTTTYALTVQGPSGPVSRALTVLAQTPREPENPSPVVNGITYNYYEGTWQTIPDLTTLTPLRTGLSTNFFPRVAGYRPQQYAIRYEGYISVPSTGYYTFCTKSDFASKLYIGASLVVDNDKGFADERSGGMLLKAGMHAMTVDYHQTTAGTPALAVSWLAPELGLLKKPVPPANLYRLPTPARTSGWPKTAPAIQISLRNQVMMITVNAPRKGTIAVTVFDQSGRMVRRRAENNSAAGVIAIDISGHTGDGRPLAPGPYICIVRMPDHQVSKTIAVIDE